MVILLSVYTPIVRGAILQRLTAEMNFTKIGNDLENKIMVLNHIYQLVCHNFGGLESK